MSVKDRRINGRESCCSTGKCVRDSRRFLDGLNGIACRASERDPGLLWNLGELGIVAFPPIHTYGERVGRALGICSTTENFTSRSQEDCSSERIVPVLMLKQER